MVLALVVLDKKKRLCITVFISNVSDGRMVKIPRLRLSTLCITFGIIVSPVSCTFIAVNLLKLTPMSLKDPLLATKNEASPSPPLTPAKRSVSTLCLSVNVIVIFVASNTSKRSVFVTPVNETSSPVVSFDKNREFRRNLVTGVKSIVSEKANFITPVLKFRLTDTNDGIKISACSVKLIP